VRDRGGEASLEHHVVKVYSYEFLTPDVLPISVVCVMPDKPVKGEVCRHIDS
jgi:hypothetical protein